MPAEEEEEEEADEAPAKECTKLIIANAPQVRPSSLPRRDKRAVATGTRTDMCSNKNAAELTLHLHDVKLNLQWCTSGFG